MWNLKKWTALNYILIGLKASFLSMHQQPTTFGGCRVSWAICMQLPSTLKFQLKKTNFPEKVARLKCDCIVRLTNRMAIFKNAFWIDSIIVIVWMHRNNRKWRRNFSSLIGDCVALNTFRSGEKNQSFKSQLVVQVLLRREQNDLGDRPQFHSNFIVRVQLILQRKLDTFVTLKRLSVRVQCGKKWRRSGHTLEIEWNRLTLMVAALKYIQTPHIVCSLHATKCTYTTYGECNGMDIG